MRLLDSVLEPVAILTVGALLMLVALVAYGHVPRPDVVSYQAQSAQGGNADAQSNSSATISQKEAAASAIAPNVYPTAPCRITGGVGGQIAGGGLSFGGSKIDAECELRETARSFAAIGRGDLALRLLCATEAAHKVLGNDCLKPTLALPPAEGAIDQIPKGTEGGLKTLQQK